MTTTRIRKAELLHTTFIPSSWEDQLRDSLKLERSIDYFLTGAGVTARELTALRVLAEDGPKPTMYLIPALGCSWGLITSVAARLERKGLITRSPSLVDKRVRMLAITEQGQDVLCRAHALLTGIIEELAVNDMGARV